MNAAIVLVGVGILYFCAYRFYCGFLAKRIFELDPERRTPAHAKEDGVDFVPTRTPVLLGHHFASITGAAPIVGPALAIIYGWVPAMLWVVFGTIFIGAVSDFGSLVISVRNQGRTLGDLVKDVIGSRGRIVFLILGVCLFILVLAVFPIIIATLLTNTPESVFPSFALIPIAVLMGYLMYRVKLPLATVTVIGLVLMAVAMLIGVSYPMGEGVSQTTWVALLLFYSFVASVVPVWILLQPRDYLNSFWLYAGLGLLAVSILFVHPTIHADAVRLSPPGAEKFPMFPFLFITIACGAVSGLHSLISSGTTSRQLNRETDAPVIGYGGMLLEGGLATVAILACTAGVASREVWQQNYANYGSVNALGGFVSGGAALMNGLGIPLEFARMFIAVTVIGFALTTLDSSARIARFMVAELGAAVKAPLTQNRYFGSAFCCVLGFCLASYKVAGKSTGQIIWPVFGVSNQVLACLALLIVSLFLYRARKPIYFTFVPMIFMLIATMWALILNLRNWVTAGQWPLVAIGVALFTCEIWLMIEGILALRRMAAGAVTKPQAKTSTDAIQ